jgi:hypothetical protein
VPALSKRGMIATRVGSDETSLSGANRVGQVTNVWQMCVASLKESNDAETQGRTDVRSREDRKRWSTKAHPSGTIRCCIKQSNVDGHIHSRWRGTVVPVGNDRIKDRLRFGIRDDSVGIRPVLSKGGATVISVGHFDDGASRWDCIILPLATL